MSFNSMLREQNETKNHEGAKAYVMSPELELYTAVVATALSNSFYEDKSGRFRTDCKRRSTVSTNTNLPSTTATTSK